LGAGAFGTARFAVRFAVLFAMPFDVLFAVLLAARFVADLRVVDRGIGWAR
jgi:hypothetical protein